MFRSSFFWLCVLIAAFQVIDTALAVYYIETIVEYNPTCDWLLNAGAVWFILAKAAGLIIVLVVLQCLKAWREWAGWAAVMSAAVAMGGVVVFQLVA